MLSGRRNIIVASITALVAGTAIPAATPAAAATTNGPLAYVNTYPASVVYLVAGSGGAGSVILPQVTQAPAFSPDGTRIAAITMGEQNLITFRTDGSDVQTVATGAATAHANPTWSPDAAQIAYLAGGPSTFQLLVTSAAPGGVPREVAAVTDFPSGLAWSPDGASILLSGLRDVYSVPAAGGTPAVIPIAGSTGAFLHGVSWSPDGSRIALAREFVGNDGATGLWTANADGSGLTQLVGGQGITMQPSWSPDGTRIAFGVQAATNQLRAANATGGGQSGSLLADFALLGTWGPTPQPPLSTTPPTVTGLAQVGQTLTAADGTWRFAGDGITRQWQRCTTTTSCTDITGQTGATYAPVSADVGMALRVTVTAANPIGTTTAASDLTAVVVAAADPAPGPTPGPAPSPAPAPPRPASLSARANHGAVVLTWAKPAQGVSGYLIQVSKNKRSWKKAGTAGPRATRFTWRKAVPGTRYFLRVAARSSAGLGPFTRPVAIRVR